MELNAYWKESPQKNSPGTESTTPRYSSGKPSSPKIGRSIQSKTCRKPVHQTTVLASTTRPSSRTGRPSLTPVDPVRHPLHPAPLEVIALDAQHRAAVVPDLRHLLAADGRTPREDVEPQEPEHGERVAQCARPPADRDLSAVAAGQGRGPVLGGLVGDVAARVGGADDQDASGGQLVGPAVLARVQLQDRRVEVPGEGGDVRAPAEAARGDDHVVAGDGVLTQARGEAAAGPRLETLDARAHPHRQVGVQRIALEVVGHLLLAGERPGRSRERHPGQAVVLGGAVELQGVPLVAPVVADALVAVDDEEGAAEPLEVVSGGEAGLAGADDQCLGVLGGHAATLGIAPVRALRAIDASAAVCGMGQTTHGS